MGEREYNDRNSEKRHDRCCDATEEEPPHLATPTLFLVLQIENREHDLAAISVREQAGRPEAIYFEDVQPA